MSYATVEAALKTVLEGISGLGADRVSLGDWRVLSMGRTPCIVILYSGFESEAAGMYAGADEMVHWAVALNLCVRYVDDAQVHDGAVALRDSVMARVQGFPTLSRTAGVMNTRVSAGAPFRQDAPQFPLLPFGQHKYSIEHITCRIAENQIVASLE